jgi:hypothetical protein
VDFGFNQNHMAFNGEGAGMLWVSAQPLS